jgi:hypothetical protein
MIDLDRVRKLKVQDGDLLIVPAETEEQGMHDLIEALRYVMPNAKVIVARGPLDQLDIGAMNDAGWYRA